MTTRISVPGERPYDVLVGRHLAGELPQLIDGAAQTAVLFAPPLLDQALAIAGRLPKPLLIEVPDAEAGKSVEVAARCWDELGAASFTRTDAVVGVGGGAVTDLAGFVAASWLRGVRWVPVSTSLLGMVDAAVGGKTGRQHRGRQEPGRRVPPARRRALRPGHARHAAGRRPGRRPGRGGQVRLHRRPGDPRADRGRPGRRGRPAQRHAARAGRAGDPGQGPRRRRRPARIGVARDPQLRPHARPRDREARGVRLEARPRGRGRPGLRRRAVPPRRPAGRRHRRPAPRGARPARPAHLATGATPGPTCSPRCGWTRRPGRDTLRFVVLDGLGQARHPGRARTKTLLERAYAEVAR